MRAIIQVQAPGGLIFGGAYVRNFTVSRRKMTSDEIVLEKPMVIKLFFLPVLVYRKSLFIISKCCNACRRVKRFQIAYANLLVFSKHYFEVRVLCFVLNGTLGDLLHKLFTFIHVIL